MTGNNNIIHFQEETKMRLEKKSDSEIMWCRIIGIGSLIVVTVLCYLVGWLFATSDGFVTRTNIALARFGGNYFAQLASVAAPIIMFIVAYNHVANAKEGEVSFTPTTAGNYVYDGWVLKSIFAGILAIVAAVIVYLVAFGGTALLIKPLMIWVWIAQGGLSAVVFYLPFCKPLRTA
jgi:hypothetical protein